MVSIIIPSFNYGFIIEETLKNLQSQSYTDWEALVIDDGSSDNTAEIVGKISSQDSRIQYHSQPTQGVSKARNLGFRLSKGEYIQFLDADDLLSEHKLTRQVAFLDTHREVDISYTDHLYFEHEKPEIHYPDYEMNHYNWLPKISGRGYEVVDILVYSNIAVVSSPVLRRNIVEKVNGFPEYTRYTEDWEFWFLCAMQNASFSFLDDPEAKTLIRIHQRNTSRNIQIMQGGELEFRKRIIDRVQNSDILTNTEKETLLEKNQKSTTKLYKYMMYHADLTSLSQLKRMVGLTSWKTFVSYYFKSLNYKRKALLKK
jgi:glycosyltransferase involved in cell wall biosynthesis